MVEERLSVFMRRYEMVKQQNVVPNQPNHMLSGEEPNQEMISMVSHMLPGEEPNQEMIRMASTIHLGRHMLSFHKSTQEIEASHLKGPTNEGFDLKAPGEEWGQEEATPKANPVATNAVALPASHEQINPSMGHTPCKLMGFVVRKTPKLDRIIQEIQQEGALIFAMQGEMVGDGSWTGSKATATQK